MLNCMPAMNSLRNKPNEMPLRFTIRDLLGLTAGVARARIRDHLWSFDELFNVVLAKVRE